MFTKIKKISFTNAQYNARTNLAVCLWNENVERGFTSVWKSNHRMPRSVKGKKNYKKNAHSCLGRIFGKDMQNLLLEKEIEFIIVNSLRHLLQSTGC